MTKNRAREIQAEFARQAQHMADAPAFRAEAGLRRLIAAIGNAPRGRVLDLACGPGIVSEAAAPHVGELVGLDATPEMIRLARERFERANLGNGRFLVGAAERLPFHGAEFDQVLTRLSLHHLGDIPAVLSEIRRILRPGGRLVIADVTSAEDAGRSALHNALERLRDPTHVLMLSRTRLVEALQSSGFSLMHEESWQQERSFAEWAAIIADPRRTAPLEAVMRALARAGEHAGIDLREQDGELRFVHTWVLLIAKSG